MKARILMITIVLVLGFMTLNAQSRVNKETKIILVISEKTNEITNLTFFGSDGGLSELKEKYPNSKFYAGLLKGDYKIEKYGLGPIIGTLVTIYTDEQLFVDDKMGNFDRMGNFKKGSVVKLGQSQAKVISKLQVEMILKVL